MTVRVRRAASMSIASMSSLAGGMISRSLVPGSQRVLTPIEPRTSTIRLTSSMRARLRRVVRPLFSKAAHRRATAAFLEVLTSMVPESCLPPSTRKWVGWEWPRETNSLSSASPMRASISRLRFWPPCSMRAMALWEVASSSARSLCVMPLWRRASRMRLPMRDRYVSVTSHHGNSHVRYEAN